MLICTNVTLRGQCNADRLVSRLPGADEHLRYSNASARTYQWLAHSSNVPGLVTERVDNAVETRCYLDSGFVALDLNKGLKLRDRIALLDKELDDFYLRDALANVGEQERRGARGCGC